MTGGFATIAGTVLAAFINMGIDPALLISASIMAAPAAAFLGYTNAGATMVYGSLVDSNYLNSLAIRNFNWNSTFVPEDKVETLAYIAEGLDQGM